MLNHINEKKENSQYTLIAGRVNEWTTPAEWQEYRMYIVAASDAAEVYEYHASAVDDAVVGGPAAVRLERYEWITDSHGFPTIWTWYIDLIRIPGGWQVASYRLRTQDPEAKEDFTKALDPTDIDMIEPVQLPAHYSRMPQMGNPFIEDDEKRDDL